MVGVAGGRAGRARSRGVAPPIPPRLALPGHHLDYRVSSFWVQTEFHKRKGSGLASPTPSAPSASSTVPAESPSKGARKKNMNSAGHSSPASLIPPNSPASSFTLINVGIKKKKKNITKVIL